MIRHTITFFVFCFWLLSVGLAVPYKKEGVAKGILTAKGEAWIDLKEDNGFQHRYLAPWVGGAPSKGGRFDPEMLGLISSTVVGNRVEVKWKFDGHLRVLGMAVIVPLEKEGVFVGKLIEIGDHWVDFQNPDDRIPWRFYLRWIGGYPENGGGYDGRSREELVAQKEEPLFRFHWSYDVRPRFGGLMKLENYQEPLFYYGKDEDTDPEETVPSSVKPGINPFDTQGSPKGNPFDGLSAPTNPFDMQDVPPVNPFDQPSAAPMASPASPVMAPKGNPFEQSAPPPQQNPFDQPIAPKGNPFEIGSPSVPTAPAGNPFEQATPVPTPTVNPFDTQVAPNKQPVPLGNPFEQAGK
jgi:hypothetical protein